MPYAVNLHQAVSPVSTSSFDRCYESLISAGSLGEVLPWISSWRRGYLKGALKDEVGAYLVVNEGDGIPGRANSKVPATLHGTFVQMIKRYFFLKTFDCWDFHCGPVVKNPPCNAGDVGLIPGWGTKIPHATEQLSPYVITRESVQCNERAHMIQWRSYRLQLRPDAEIIHNLKKTQQSERQLMEWEKRFVNCIFSKGLISII